MEPAPAIDSDEVGGPQGGAAAGQGFEYAKGQREHQSTLEDMPKLEPAAVEVADDEPLPGAYKRCIGCNKQMKDEGRHNRLAHGGPNSFTCAGCQGVYSSRSGLQAHIRSGKCVGRREELFESLLIVEQTNEGLKQTIEDLSYEFYHKCGRVQQLERENDALKEDIHRLNGEVGELMAQVMMR